MPCIKHDRVVVAPHRPPATPGKTAKKGTWVAKASHWGTGALGHWGTGALGHWGTRALVRPKCHQWSLGFPSGGELDQPSVC